MPELAEVEYYRKRWSPALGQFVVRVRLHSEKRIFRGADTGALVSGLKDARFHKALRHGKQMCFRFDDRYWLGVHLGMTGKLRLSTTGEPKQPHDHLVIEMQAGDSLIFSDPRLFGRIQYGNTSEVPIWWRDLPPELLSDGFTLETMSQVLTRRSRAPIKAVLLLQAFFPGIGNWMADEILWRARIHPATPAGSLSAFKRRALYARIREVCSDALAVIGNDWQRPPDAWLFNHRWRDGGRCPKTGAALQRATVGGRTTCWSPKWQRRAGLAKRDSSRPTRAAPR